MAKQRRLVSLLYEWVRLSPKGIKEVRPKVTKLLADDDFVAFLALDTFRTTSSHSMGGFGGVGDLVARGRTEINKEPISEFTNPKRFLACIEKQWHARLIQQLWLSSHNMSRLGTAGH